MQVRGTIDAGQGNKLLSPHWSCNKQYMQVRENRKLLSTHWSCHKQYMQVRGNGKLLSTHWSCNKQYMQVRGNGKLLFPHWSCNKQYMQVRGNRKLLSPSRIWHDYGRKITTFMTFRKIECIVFLSDNVIQYLRQNSASGITLKGKFCVNIAFFGKICTFTTPNTLFNEVTVLL